MKAIVFDWEKIWGGILEKNQISEDEEKNAFTKFLRTFPENVKLEDTELYKSYLSKFVLGEELSAKDFCNECNLTFEESSLLFKLVAASFTTNYDIAYLPESDKLELSIHVSYNGQIVTKKLQEMIPVQIFRLFFIYLEEDFKFEHIKSLSEGYKDAVNEDREERLLLFAKKKKECLDMIHGHAEGSAIENKLDELLNS